MQHPFNLGQCDVDSRLAGQWISYGNIGNSQNYFYRVLQLLGHNRRFHQPLNGAVYSEENRRTHE